MSQQLATQQAEIEVIRQPKGFEELRTAVNASIEQQKDVFITLSNLGIQTGKLIVEYSQRAEIKEAVERLNTERQKTQRKGGRPQEAHCFVAELLVRSGMRVSKDWLEKCARAFKRSKELGFEGTETGVNKLLALKPANGDAKFPVEVEQILPNPERVFPPEAVAEKQPCAPKTFKQFVEGFVARLDSLESSAGEVSLRNKRHQELWADGVEKWFTKRGVKIQITFKG